MKLPFRETLYNCKESTLLSIKREEGRISMLERLKLAYHLWHCAPCRRFVHQWHTLGRKRGDATVRAPFAMPKEARQRIQDQLDLIKS
jgi:hypothetical protein